jgi:hypothetical protein
VKLDVGNNGSAISGSNGQVLIAGNPSTLKMHMTGIESFNVASKRGGPANIPMNTTSTGSTGQPLGSGINDSSSQVMDGRTITTNKSSMRKYSCYLKFKLFVLLCFRSDPLKQK